MSEFKHESFKYPKMPFSKFGCKCIDILEKELERKIQHKHFMFETKQYVGTEHTIKSLRYKSDGYIKLYDGTNAIIEILGDEWHGHPILWDLNLQQYKPRFEYTDVRFKSIKLIENYRIFYVWQRDIELKGIKCVLPYLREYIDILEYNDEITPIDDLYLLKTGPDSNQSKTLEWFQLEYMKSITTLNIL